MTDKARNTKRSLDCLSEGRQCKARLDSFSTELIEGLALSSEDMLTLISADESRKDKNVYLYFPFCFAEVFETDIQVLRSLSYAGMLWMSYARYQDDVVDGSVQARPTELLIKDSYVMQFMRELHAFFPADSQFWKYFSRYYREFARASVQEKYKQGRRDGYTEADFETIARGKAAMAKCAVAALGVLSGRMEPVAVLEQSIDAFHIAYQHYDDLLDWKADVKTGGYSWLLANADAKRPPAERNDRDLERIGRIIYYSGVAEDALSRGLASAKRAYDLSKAAGCALWSVHVQRLITQIGALRADLTEIAHQSLMNSELPAGPTPHPAIINRRGVPASGDIERTVARAADYLCRQQRPDGTWSDFAHGGTIAVEWTTAYVGEMVKSIPCCADARDRAGAALATMQSPAGGWGWEQRITPTDADSTAWTMLFLDGQEVLDSAAKARAAATLMAFRDERNGGFATYQDGSDLRVFLGSNHPPAASVAGWCTPQSCVTALAIEAAIRADSLDRRGIAQTLGFLRAAQSASGMWESYWWDGPFYATCHSIRALQSHGEAGDKTRVARAVEWLLANQAEDGSWGAETIGRNIAFHTALALSALMWADPGDVAAHALERGAAWLWKFQLADGSWAPMRMLRIPAPDVSAPWASTRFTESPGELNVLLRDLNALFTTSTAAHALQQFLEYQRSQSSHTEALTIARS